MGDGWVERDPKAFLNPRGAQKPLVEDYRPPRIIDRVAMQRRLTVIRFFLPRFVANASVRAPVNGATTRRGDAQKTRAVAKKHLPTDYEGVILLRPDCDDATRAGAIDGFKSMLGEGLQQWEQTEHGLKPNSYDIKGYPDAYQVVVNFTCAPETYAAAAEELAKPAVGSEEVIIRTMFLKTK